MLLTIDIGNTNIKIGVYQDERLAAHWRVTTERHRLADEYLVLLHNLFDLGGIDPREIDGCAISCVVPPLTGEFRTLCRTYFHVEPLMVSAATPTGLRYNVDTPAELGADRIANSLAAFRRYGGPVIVLAFGTATTFDVITADGEYIGGAIAPGIGISADALFRLAAKLYQVELVRPPSVIGKNTIHHMQSGVILGYAGLVEGLVHRMQTELGTSCPVVATGGLAELIAAETEAITIVEPYLTLEGLRLIYEMNRS
ncbi:MAG: type III pantothenate kinase [Roseiflexus sp.]|jgi:type III pantothenate kinase|nr:type III pantothenate kinase [Roseiflexus sp.]MBO9365866.1 type III pantothenate kinase [Roseiflexus sp.]MBO9381766.1 type III pantothenate kinase [Roseiflexus sp.]MBO9388584.1 type III pantothenate kinase [Roseiflexus sp.]